MKLKLIALAITTVGLAGCAAGTATQVQSDITSFAQAVQSATVAACGVEPAVASVADIIASLTPASAAVTTATNLAGQICKAVVASSGTPVAGRFRASFVPRPVVVNGVTVTFVPVTK